MIRLCAFLALAGAGLAAEPAATPLAADDSIVFVRDGDLHIVRADGLGVRRLTSTIDRESRPCGSPDGSAIAYEVYDSERSDYDVWLCSADGTAQTRLLPRARNPAWSPDAGRLLFAAQQRGTGLDIWLCNRHGQDLTRITNTVENDYLPCWSPDGTQLAFVREESAVGAKNYLLIRRDATGAEEELLRLADRRITSLVWSPQRDLLVGAREPGGNLERLYRLDPAGARRLDELTTGPDEEIFGTWTFGLPGLLYVERRGASLRIAQRPLGGAAQSIAGVADGDSEPALLPGPSRRVAQVFVFGRRSFYLPAPILLDGEVLIPAPDLAAQLGLRMEPEPNRITLRREGKTVILDLLTNEVISGEETRLLGINCEEVGGVRMLPLRAVAEEFGLRSDWREESRILRVG